MTLGELLDGAFVMFRRHFTTLVGIAVVCYLPFQAMRLYATVSGGWTGHLLLLCVALLLSAVGGLIGAAATLKVISDGYLNRDCSVGDALRFSLSKIGGLMVAGFARFILIALGFVLLIIPGIIIACGYSVVNQIVVLEDPASPLDSLGRSWKLTKDFKGRAFALAFILGIVAAMPSIAAGFMIALLHLSSGSANILLAVLGAVTGLILAPLIPCGMTLFYYDLRIRKEAFDLQTLEQQISGSA
jgi:uncharacterized membrane protein